MSLFAIMLRTAYKLSGTKKAFSLPKEELRSSWHAGAAVGKLSAVQRYVESPYRGQRLGGICCGEGGIRYVQNGETNHRLVRRIQR